MPRILPTYTAPDAGVLRGASQAWTQAGRRLGSIYNEIASADQAIGRTKATIGNINAQNIKNQLWPEDIGRLVADQENQQRRARGVNIRVDPRVDITGVAGTGFDPENYITPRTHYQTSRGAASLGAALSDGGYGVASSGPGSVEYAGSNGVDYPSAAGPTYQYNPSPAQIAMDKINAARDAAVANYTDQLVATRDYYTQYYNGPGSQYQTDQTHNQAIAESAQQQGGSSSGIFSGIFSGLSDMFGGADQSGADTQGGTYSGL